MNKLIYFFLSCLFITSIANAQTWNGTVSNVWTNPLNWTPNVVPVAASGVLINPAPNIPKLPANTTLAALSTSSGASLDFNGFTLSVGNVNGFNAFSGTTFLNTNGATDIVMNITTPSAGYNFQINGCTFSDHVTINLNGNDQFLEAQSSANTYNGNVTFNISSNLTTNFCIAGPSQFNGNLNVNRTVAGSSNWFITGGTVTGNFNYQNLVGGSTGFGNATNTTTINGTCTINASFPSPNFCNLSKIKNLTTGGTINIQNCVAPTIQFDTLKVTSFIIQGYEGNDYARFFNNKIDGNITLEDDAGYGGGYYTEFRNNTFTGITTFTLKGTNIVYESSAANTGSVYNGNTTFNLAGSGGFYFAYSDTSIVNGNLTVNRTVPGYSTLFGSGAIINGNLTYNNTSAGNNDLGNSNIKTAVSGTVNMNVNLTAVNRFNLHRIVNQTSGGKINVFNSSGFSLQRDTLKVDSLNVMWYRGSEYGFFYENNITGHVTLADSTNYGGGYASYIRNSTITGNTNIRLYGTNNFYEALTTANTFNGNLVFDIYGLGALYTSYQAKSTITGNYTVNRSGPGYTYLFGNAATIGGNFSCVKNANGSTDMGTLVSKTTVGGTVSVNITQSLGDAFSLHRIQNSTNGGSITVNGSKSPSIQQDTLLLNSLSINGYGGSEYLSVYNNQLTANVTFSDDASFSGGYTSRLGNCTITGNTVINSNGTNHFYEAHNAANTFNGNLTFNIAGSGNLYTSYSGKSTVSGNYTVNRTGAGYMSLFGNAASIAGNFFCTRNAAGGTDLGNISSKTTIAGTINMNITQTLVDDFSMHRVQNSTNGGSIVINTPKSPSIQQDTLIVSSFAINGYGGANYLYFYNNQITGNVSLSDHASFGGGYASYIRNSSITGNTTITINGFNNLYEAYTQANSFTGNLDFNVTGSGGLYTSHGGKSTITGNYTVNRTAGGLLDLLGNAATIGGNFSCVKNAGGSVGIGHSAITSTIAGTVTINLAQGFGDALSIFRLKNNTNGGSVTINTCRAPSIQNDTLKVTTFDILNYGGAAFAYFYENQLEGALNISPDPSFGGGYSSYFRGNTIFGNATISNPSPNIFNDADAGSSGNVFLGNVTYARTGGTLNVATGDTNSYYGNLTFNNLSASPINAELIKFTGSTNTFIDQLGTAPITIQKIILNKTGSSSVTLNKPVLASVSCTFVTGYLNSTTSNPLIFADNVNHSGASDASHVIGSVTKAGNDIFSFPLGNGIGYHPIGITAPSTTADTFQASIVLKHPSVDGYDVTLKDAALLQIAPYHYWTLNQINGSNAETVSLGWSIPCSNTVIASLPGMAVARWNGSLWNNLGNSATTGTTSLGTVSMVGTTPNYGVFALATTSASNSWQITAVTASASTVCAGTSTSLTASGAATYNWQPGNLSGSSVVLTPLTTTTYTITGTSATGCVTTATKTITVNPVPTANAGADKTNTCTTPSNTIGTAGVAGTTYAWLPTSGLSASNIAQPTANPAATTNYTVTATITATGCTASDVVIVTVNKTPPVANAGTDKTNTCTTPSNTIGTAAVGGVTYAWLPVTGLSSATAAQPTANPATTTTYTVTATNTSNGCTATDAVLVTVNKTPPVANAGADVTNTCTTPSNTVGTAAVGGVTYAWLPVTGLSSSTVAQPTANPAATTTYTITATNTANGCTATDNVVVTVNKTAPSANAGADVTNTCTTPSNTIGTASVAGNTYAWLPTTGLSSATVAQPVANPTATTTYTVTVTTTANGCTATDAVIVTINKTAPSANAGTDKTNTCTTPSNTIGTASVAGNTYAWLPATGLSSATLAQPVANPAATTNYTVTVTTTANGCTASDIVIVTVNKTAPTVSNSATATSICSGQSTTITATGANTYSWQPGSLSGASVIVSPTSTTTYTVTGTSTANGCTATSTRTISVTACATNLTVKAFLQGYYMGAGTMQPVLINQGQTNSVPNQCDVVTLELHNTTAPYGIASTVNRPILQDGTITATYFNIIGQSYYIVLKHRNGLETWSAAPVVMTNTMTYDFTTAANKAYGSNQLLLSPGIWGIYSGDINHDISIDVFDYLIQEPDVVAGNSGYLNTDLNGDGSVDVFDYLVMEPWIVLGVSAATP
ncbi:MAG: hypothetical protein JNM95_09245 [Chitinophagaceae bacterium]|nr:hypothetical protein [Chitinophagaceae bacterium]